MLVKGFLERMVSIFFRLMICTKPGEMAQSVRNRKTGRDAYFNVNRHINLTNICMSRCKFCAFGRDKDDPGAYCMTVEDAVRLGREALPMNITELHVVSALHPDLPFQYYVDVVKALRQNFPGIHIQVLQR